MNDYDARLIDTLGRDGLLEFAGAILSAGQEATTEEETETANRAVTKLLDMAEAHTSPPEPESRERDPEAPAYVPDVWASPATYHALGDSSPHFKTRCKLSISWRQKSAMVPLRLVENGGQPCQLCYAPERSDD